VKMKSVLIFSVSLVVLDSMVSLKVRITETFSLPSPICFTYYDLISNLCTSSEMSANLCIADKYFISSKYDFRSGTASRVLNNNVPAETFMWKQ
jgi:hypothetical protein